MNEHGRIPTGACVLLRTGWSHRQSAQAFLNADETGPAQPRSEKGRSAHTLLHGAGRFGLASLANLDRLPATGAVVIAASLKIVYFDHPQEIQNDIAEDHALAEDMARTNPGPLKQRPAQLRGQ